MDRVARTTPIAPTTHGVCLQSSLAEYLGLAIDSVPRFDLMVRSEWKLAMIEWAGSMGYEFTEHIGTPTDDRKYIAVGASTRGITHCVVWQSGQVIFDILPDKSGLTSIKKFWSFEAIPLADESYYDAALYGSSNLELLLASSESASPVFEEDD